MAEAARKEEVKYESNPEEAKLLLKIRMREASYDEEEERRDRPSLVGESLTPMLNRTEGVTTATAETSATTAAAEVATNTRRSLWSSVLRWIPTSTDHVIAAEKRLLSIIKTPYTQELVNIGSSPAGSKVRWFHSVSNEPRFINTVTFDSKEGSPTLVMVHGYAASQGFFFRNFDAIAKHFKVIAIDLLGWGGSNRPDFTCKSTKVI